MVAFVIDSLIIFESASLKSGREVRIKPLYNLVALMPHIHHAHHKSLIIFWIDYVWLWLAGVLAEWNQLETEERVERVETTSCQVAVKKIVKIKTGTEGQITGSAQNKSTALNTCLECGEPKNRTF